MISLQLVNNAYYCFGAEKYGLKIMFDDNFEIKTVGEHYK